jgi:hypothetical protein
MPSTNGESAMPDSPLELQETLYIETTGGESLAFEVVGILEDPEAGASYAVLLHEPADHSDQQFIVTDLSGNLLEDDSFAQQILDEFLAHAGEESGSPEEETH